MVFQAAFCGLPKRGIVARLSRRNEVPGDKLSKGKQLRAERDYLLRAEKDKEAALSGNLSPWLDECL